MNTEKIKSLEEQTEELIENISSIKRTLTKKVSAQAQFEEETSKISKSLAEVVTEINLLHSLFQSLGESEMIELFDQINETHDRLNSLIPELQITLGEGLSDFKTIYHQLEATNNDLSKDYARHLSGITSLTNTIENYQQYMNLQIKSAHDDLLKQLSQFETKVEQYETRTNETMHMIMDRLEKSEQNQRDLLNKTDSILEWLETNGDILIANSRAGIFGRKR